MPEFAQRWAAVLPICGVLAAATACAQVTVQAGDGSVSRDIRFGIVSLDLRPGTTAQIVEIEGVGIVGQNGAITLGYLSSNTVLLPAQDCRLVVWVERAADASADLAPLLDGQPEICAVGPGAR